MNSETLIKASGIFVQYEDNVVLHNIDFSIGQREIVTLLGPNGSGKTTLLRILIGAIQPDKGQITAQDGLRIGYVPQRLGVDQRMPMTVRRYVGLGARCNKDEQMYWLQKVGLQDALKQQVSALSGGQLQRVLFVQALMADPHILILDEATQGLDQQGEASFYKLIAEVRDEQGCAVLMVSHDLHVVMSASDRVICLNGHVCCEGEPTIVSAAPEYRALFGLGTEGALALYRHEHDHSHDHTNEHSHEPLQNHAKNQSNDH